MKRRILFTDYEAERLFNTGSGLDDHYELDIAQDLNEASDLLRQKPFDLVLVGRPDCDAPLEKILQFAKNLREQAKRRVILIGDVYSVDGLREYDMERTKANDAVALPTTNNTLRKRINKILNNDSLVTGTFREDLRKDVA